MPVRFFEGVRDAEQSAVKIDDSRFLALAAAIREHQSASRRNRLRRPQDDLLYRRLRQICADPAAGGLVPTAPVHGTGRSPDQVRAPSAP